jgi:hypothetical protein
MCEKYKLLHPTIRGENMTLAFFEMKMTLCEFSEDVEN